MSPNEWTLMLYFGSDNALAPSVVAQLKAIKDAGFQRNTNVLVYFDPNEVGAPTRLFNVNQDRKAEQDGSKIGDGRNPFVFMIGEDSIGEKELGELAVPASEMKEFEKLIKPDALSAEKGLELFLEFCRKTAPARHYILFLVGHGLIVGNDAFLPDENPSSAITLKELGNVIRGFTRAVRRDGSALELIGMHSCSMSGIEVAYELKGTAKYMMATQGISFVGSWPYRQLLKRVFNAVDGAHGRGAEVNIKELVKSLYFLCLCSASDFLLAGFSSDLCLCDLNPRKVKRLDKPVRRLTRALKDALSGGKSKRDRLRRAEQKKLTLQKKFTLENTTPNGKPPRNGTDQVTGVAASLVEARSKVAEFRKAALPDDAVGKLILMAHWKAQSYWQQMYTDLFDFCRCLSEMCDESDPLQKEIKDACKEVMGVFDPKERHPFDGLVVYCDHVGPTYQYSHGLSIYFPWSRPVEDSRHHILKNYRHYAFTKELKGDAWLTFLRSYLDVTQRLSREVEDGDDWRAGILKVAKLNPKAGSSLTASTSLEGPGGGIKSSPADAGGVGCDCQTIQNFSDEFSISERAFKAFVRPDRRVK